MQPGFSKLSTADAGSSDRRSDIDWLRVLAFGLLIFYHAGLPYVAAWDWHIKDDTDWSALREVMRFVSFWRMPIIFLIAGGTIMLSLGRRSAPEFVLDRLKRIFLPLLFGVLVIVPPQVYFQRLQEGDFSGSYFEFYPHFFEGIYPDGNFGWHHLWFLAYVLVLALVLLPVLLWIRSPRGAAVLNTLSAFAARHYLFGLFALPLLAAQFWLAPISSSRNHVVGDWYGLAFYGTLMLTGAVLYRNQPLLQSLERQRWVALVIGVIAYATLRAEYFGAGFHRPQNDMGWLGLYAVSTVNLMAWLIAFVGFARHWARPTKFLRYATPAVYPFYILHQTLTVAAAFYLVQTGWATPVKYFVVVAVTFGGSWWLYEWLIKRVALLRLLFGMGGSNREKPKPAANAIRASST